MRAKFKIVIILLVILAASIVQSYTDIDERQKRDGFGCQPSPIVYEIDLTREEYFPGDMIEGFMKWKTLDRSDACVNPKISLIVPTLAEGNTDESSNSYVLTGKKVTFPINIKIPETAEAKAYFLTGEVQCSREFCDNTGVPSSSTLMKKITIAEPACREDIDCTDSNTLTQDSCIKPGTRDARCINEQCKPQCNSNADCDDGNELTSNYCHNPSKCNASCINEPCKVTCKAANECKDDRILTYDVCENAATCSSFCKNVGFLRYIFNSFFS